MTIDRDKLGEIIRFGIVGVLATTLHYGVYLGLLWLWPNLNTRLAYTIVYVFSFVANFLASNYYTFKTRPTTQKGLGFALSHGVNYLLHILLLSLFLALGVPDKWAPIPVFAIAIPVNFIMVRFFLKR